MESSSMAKGTLLEPKSGSGAAAATKDSVAWVARAVSEAYSLLSAVGNGDDSETRSMLRPSAAKLGRSAATDSAKRRTEGR